MNDAHVRATAFLLGDLLFLGFVGAVGAAVMFAGHLAMGHFVFAAVAGMAAAMGVQMLLAFAAAPVLGSIESMVPGMLVGMTAPMTVCAAHLAGFEWSWISVAIIGCIVGAAVWLALLLYAMSCRVRLRRSIGAVEVNG